MRRVSVRVSYKGTTATFAPSVTLLPNTIYTATITTGAKDLAGNALAGNYVWNFTTGAAPDTTPPMVSATAPASKIGRAPSRDRVEISVVAASLKKKVNTSSFSLKQGLPADVGIAVSGTVRYRETTATFARSVTLLPNAAYTATVTTGVKDLAGNALAGNYVWSFTTGAAPDTTPPMVSATAPASNATAVPINEKIDATFTEALDAATVNTASFTLKSGERPVGEEGRSRWTPDH